jgi:hypothetical protein
MIPVAQLVNEVTVLTRLRRIGASRGVAPLILIFGTKVSGKLQAPAALATEEYPGTYRIVSFVGPEPIWTLLEKRKILYHCRESNCESSSL